MAVYFARAGNDGPVKIGHAGNPRRRLAVLQTGNPETLHLIRVIEGGVETEAAVHAEFSEHRIKYEWFTFHEAMLQYGQEIIQPRKELKPVDIETDVGAVDFVAAKIGGGAHVHGKYRALAKALGISPQAVNNWRDSERGISATWRPVIWAMVNDHGGNLSREWLMPRSAAA